MSAPVAFPPARLESQFASDNTAPICPEAWAALERANVGARRSYGDDELTAEASAHFRRLFDTELEVFFVFNGTAANSLALASLCQSYHSILVHEKAHVETDECGAPEFYSNGAKLLLVPGAHGKLDVAELERIATRRRDLHFPRPRAVSLSQSTEVGTVYTVDELRSVCAVAHDLGLKVHMDGARFANAVAALGCAPGAVTKAAGIDVLCFGGTKNGGGLSEAVVFFDLALAEEFAYRCKQAGQLASKMRYLAAPWVAMLQDDTWLRHARHANAMARDLAERLGRLPEVRLLEPTEANAVFVELPPAAHTRLQERGWLYYQFIGSGGARLMCSWATRPEDLDALMADLTT
jgi:threonine aldolase